MLGCTFFPLEKWQMKVYNTRQSGNLSYNVTEWGPETMLPIAEKTACPGETESFAGILERDLEIFSEIIEDVHLADGRVRIVHA